MGRGMTSIPVVYSGECGRCGHGISQKAPLKQEGQMFRCAECGNITLLTDYRGENVGGK